MSLLSGTRTRPPQSGFVQPGNPEAIAEFSFPEWWINFNPTLIAAQKRG
jgi:hypothetical protein